MPVLLEHLTQPNSADWQDLEKIHQDTADNGLTLSSEQLQQWLAEEGWIMAGRFNDRILGALLAKEHDNLVELSQAGVRTLTQKRGVMHQLLHFICAWSQEHNKTLVIKTLPTNLQQSVLARGFQKRDEAWYYPAKS